MKKRALILISVLLALAACTKQAGTGKTGITHTIPEDPGCITQIYNHIPFKETIPIGDSFYAVKLLTENGILLDNLVILLMRYQEFDSFKLTTVQTKQYINGVFLLGSDCEYVFNYEQLLQVRGTVTATTDMDTIRSLKPGQLRTLYLGNVHDRDFTDSCFVAQFGYYNLNAGSAEQNPARLIKAWEVHTSGAFFPVAYIGDDGTVYRVDLGYIRLRP